MMPLTYLIYSVRCFLPHKMLKKKVNIARNKLSEFNPHFSELDKNKSYVIHCKSDQRSRKAVKLLQNTGFTSVKNLTGGITAWAHEIDKNMPVY